MWYVCIHTHTHTHIMENYQPKKEENSDICYNMDESWGHYAKWSKPVTKRQISNDDST